MFIGNPSHLYTPPGWSACDAKLSSFTPPTNLGFVCGPGDLNRFCSRYRVAKSFKEISLDYYSPDTAGGYSALFRIFLTWSAFEQFLDICGLTIDGVEPLLTPYNPEAIEAKIRSIPGYDTFLRFVLDWLERAKHRSQVESFLSNKPCNLLYIPAGIRHIFAHGILTPHSGSGNTVPPQQISTVLCEFLFRVMDGEFLSRLRAHGVAV